MRIILNLSIVLIFFLGNVQCHADNKILPEIFSLAKQKKWQESYALAKKYKNKAVTKIILSQQYQDEKYPKNSFKKITKFIRENPNWPQSYILRSKAEKLITPTTDAQIIIKWFSKNKPITGNGHKYYALAASKFIKKQEHLVPIIKTAWKYGNFTDEEHESFYKKFKKYLTLNDHVKKIDNYLWNSNITEATKSLKYVNDGYKNSFNAQIALIKNKKNARKLFKRVNKKYYTSGLIYRYLCSRKLDLPNSQEIVNLLKLAEKDTARADNFWKIQSYLAREFIAKRKYRDAYRLVSSVFTSNPANRSNAEYLSGWLALVYLKKTDLAFSHFRNFNRIVKTPISKSRGIYWLARTYEYKKEQEKADRLYKLSAKKYPYSFYGQMSMIELNERKISFPMNVNISAHPQDINSNIKNNDIVRAALIISQYGSNSQSRIYINAAVSLAKTDEDIFYIIGSLANLKNTHHITWGAKKAIQKHVFIKNHAFPVPYKLKNPPIEKPLIYSIIRQESVFDKNALSSANAMGLMQLIKSTACSTAKTIGDKCRVLKLTTDENYNIKLGSNYLSQMIKEFDGSYILAIASYNAGAHNVSKWLKTFGDPREMSDYRQVINWLEHIPYYETRNYTQRVLENLQIYRSILRKNNRLELLNDLTAKKWRKK